MEQQDKRPAPPYLSFATLNGFIDGLGVNMPTRIDKSLMKSMSGGSQAALTSALDYLKLREGGDKPSETLVRLAAASGEKRAPLWKALLQERYPFLFSDQGFDLRRATQGELDERFRQEGVSGETIRKCVAFFMAAAQAAGIEVSPHFRSIKSRAPRSRGSGAPRSSRRTRRNVVKDESGDVPPPPPPPTGGTIAATWRLPNGGKATLTVTGDPFALTKAMRDDLFALADKMREYDAKSAGSNEPTPDADGAAES